MARPFKFEIKESVEYLEKSLRNARTASQSQKLLLLWWLKSRQVSQHQRLGLKSETGRVITAQGVKPVLPVQWAAAIDIGLDNLATIVFNAPRIQPIAVKGKPLKSVNQFYNKQVAKYKGFIKTRTSHRIQNIVRIRNNFVDSYLHQCTRMICNEFLALGVTQVAIGKNDQWKTNINLGKKTNQKFVQVPHARFIEILAYKLEAVGIIVVVGEESYTSIASFLDWDIIPTYAPDKQQYLGSARQPVFGGKRVLRSWYTASDGSKIHADVNGAFNIGRKVILNSWVKKSPSWRSLT